MRRLLTAEQAARTYDRIGRWQDTQRFYEDPAFAVVLRHGAFERATSVLELGCGTGRNARRLLKDSLAPDCRYLGVDVSATMVELTRLAIAPWADRAKVVQADATTFECDERFDCILSLFVVDLLSDDAIAAFLATAHRLLAPGGRLCIGGLAEGKTGLPRMISSLWKRVHALRPEILGGCRPLAIGDYVNSRDWCVVHRERLCAYGFCSEALVASDSRPTHGAFENEVCSA